MSVVCASDNPFPSTFYITFQRDKVQVAPDGSVQPQSPLVVQFMNGTACYPETASFTFSMEETTKDEYIVKFTLFFDGFCEEVSLPATVSNGRVYIDSIATIFVVNPDTLIDGNTIQITQTEILSLFGTVERDAWVPTMIPNLTVDDVAFSKLVQGSYQQTNSAGSIMGTHELFFDSKTGVLIRPPVGYVSDVTLSKMSITSISGGVFLLLDYSENLNFTIETYHYSSPDSYFPFFSWWLFLIPVFVVVFVSVGFFVYRASSLKKRNRVQQKTFLNKTLKFNFISNIVLVRCFYGL
ncbi:MAG: hypothetical protein LBH62_05420 [Nitrososphaerota archaeon]|jgi:hypothetical protein|nr:hypothetical protein [Nitrososphaerota archaeon]